MGQRQKKERTEGATGLGRITREQIEKWNQMTALRVQAGGDKCLTTLQALHGEVFLFFFPFGA